MKAWLSRRMAGQVSTARLGISHRSAGHTARQPAVRAKQTPVPGPTARSHRGTAREIIAASPPVEAATMVAAGALGIGQQISMRAARSRG